jgi:hypothetical protein
MKKWIRRWIRRWMGRQMGTMSLLRDEAISMEED